MDRVQVEVYELVPVRNRWLTPTYVVIAVGAIAFGVLAALLTY